MTGTIGQFYRPDDWYWFIGSDTQNVWSSARAMLVPGSDPDYAAWLARVGGTQTMDTMADLEATLAISYPRGTPRTYAADSRYRKASGGLTVTSLAPDKVFATDTVSRNTIDSAYGFSVSDPSQVFSWKMSDGSFVQLDAAGVATLMNAVATFVQACFTCEGTLSAGIDDGSITTLAQIDDAFGAISNVVP